MSELQHAGSGDMLTSLANIDSVMVAGHWKTRNGQLMGVDLSYHSHALASPSTG